MKYSMTVTMWITVMVLVCSFQFQQTEAQITVSGTEKDDLTLPCALTGGNFTLPEWRGPPNLLIYTNQDDASEAINPVAPASTRLHFADNKKDLILSNAQSNDSGVYKCTYSALGDYTVTLTVTAEQCTCDCNCKKVCKGIVIPSIVFGGLGAVTLTVVIGGTVTEHFGRITALVVDVIGIVFDVITSVLGIVVQGQDCCKDAEDCCEDSDCCEVECKRNWVENTGAAFIAIGALVGIVAGAIFYLIWLGRIGPGNNGGNDGGNNGGRGHGGGHGTNSNTVHSRREDTHRGTLSDRANSDGEVSRKDVHVQENRDNFSGRPMPPIPPLTDKKGRGLSANYDDDHPMTSVGIPDKKAGQLVPLKEQEEQKKKEESKKRRKRKKKAVSDDDDDDDDVV